MELVAIVGSCGTRLCHAHATVARPHLVNATLPAPKWPPAVGQCGQVGVVELFIIFCDTPALPLCPLIFLLLFYIFFFFFTLPCGCFVFGSCPFLRLRHSRLFISNFISYEFVCFYRKTRRRVAAKHKQTTAHVRRCCSSATLYGSQRVQTGQD